MVEKILEEKKVWDKITIINPAPAVALQTQRVLKTFELHNEQKKENLFYSTWNENILENFVENIIKDFPDDIQKVVNTYKSKFNHLNI